MNATLYFIESFMFLVLFQSQRSDHFLPLSASQEKHNYNHCCLLTGGPRSMGPEASEGAQSCAPFLFRPSTAGRAAAIPHSVRHSESRRHFHLLRPPSPKSSCRGLLHPPTESLPRTPGCPYPSFCMSSRQVSLMKYLLPRIPRQIPNDYIFME